MKTKTLEMFTDFIKEKALHFIALIKDLDSTIAQASSLQVLCFSWLQKWLHLEMQISNPRETQSLHQVMWIMRSNIHKNRKVDDIQIRKDRQMTIRRAMKKNQHEILPALRGK